MHNTLQRLRAVWRCLAHEIIPRVITGGIVSGTTGWLLTFLSHHL